MIFIAYLKSIITGPTKLGSQERLPKMERPKLQCMFFYPDKTGGKSVNSQAFAQYDPHGPFFGHVDPQDY